MPRTPRLLRGLALILPFLLLAATAALALTSPAAAQSAPAGLVADAWGYAPDSDAARAGWAGHRGDAGAGQMVAPGAPAAILFHLGAKSLIAGRDIGMAAALVTDRAGNLVAAGTEVRFALADQRLDARTDAGIAATRFQPQPRAGHYTAGAAVAGLQSGPADFEVTPDIASVRLSPLTQDRPGTVEELLDLQGPALTDRFGNALSDGTGLQLWLRGQAGAVALVPAQVVAGAVRARLLARDLGAGADLSGQALLVLGGAGQASGRYDVAPLRPLGPPLLRAHAGPWGLTVEIGPLTTDAGHALPDGAPLTLTATTARGATLTATAWTVEGRARADFAADAADLPLRLQIAGPLGRFEARLTTLEAAP